MSKSQRLVAVRTVLIAALALTSVAGRAQAPEPREPRENYPSRPIRLVVPFTSGGVADLIARLLAERLSERLPQRVFVENRPGAGGNIGFEHVARSPADGHTIVMASPGFAINPSMTRDLGWDPVDDFAPITMVASIPNVIVVGTQQPYRSLAELLAAARAKPGSITFGSAGIGSSPHLAGELLNSAAQVSMTHVPYKGQADAVRDLLEGSLTFMALTAALARPQIAGGKMRALGVTTAKRAEALPDVPTVAEAGVPGYEVDAWIALLAPRGTPPAVVGRLNAAVRETLERPDVVARLTQLGSQVSTGTPEALGEYIRIEKSKWARTIGAAGIKP